MLKEQITKDVISAMKSRDTETAGVLRMLMSAVNAKEKDKKYKASLENKTALDLTDEDVIEAVSSEIKKRKDAVVLYEQGNRPELAAKEKKEIEILQKYLPEQLALGELEKLIKESIERVGAKEMKDMGRVMADLSSKIKGRADGAQVSKIIKEFLNQ